MFLTKHVIIQTLIRNMKISERLSQRLKVHPIFGWKIISAHTLNES